ncbi:unnamed protein product [Cylindrotheca closterium]|uniref:Uncharacterized protein n=1 Tax=Cylindrotheca closterium TaxID=2856 RepID=A0AAD2FAT3_9STRA|nr:unnamed protein product [Cylindrotheca closterium]
MPKVNRKKASDVVDSLGSPDKSEEDKGNNKASPTVSDAKAKSKKMAPEDPKSIDPPENDSFDVVLPSLLGTANAGECTLMVEVSPEDARLLDYEGMSGAIGRFEANHHGVIVDLKGNRYHGSILPGPTAMVVNLVKGGQLKVEGITDEYATLAKSKDVMKSLDAVVKGEFDDGFRVRDDNVNKTARQAAAAKVADKKAEDNKSSVTPKTKRRASVTPAKKSSGKKKKTT